MHILYKVESICLTAATKAMHFVGGNPLNGCLVVLYMGLTSLS